MTTDVVLSVIILSVLCSLKSQGTAMVWFKVTEYGPWCALHAREITIEF